MIYNRNEKTKDKVKKSDMLVIDGTQLCFSNMGLFESEAEWIHPVATTDTYELIFVRFGRVHIAEGEDEYLLKAGDMLLLDPHREHRGTAVSTGLTSFYWLHFYTDQIGKFPFPKHFTPTVNVERTLTELMHLQESNRTLAELTLAELLLELGQTAEYGNKRAYEIAEFIRINAHRPLTVLDVARHFGYSADHLSKILKREFGYDTKTAIIKRRAEHIESLLINTDYSVKEIALQCGFDDENKFVKFFKYHEGITPTQFRNRFFHVHMNSK